MIRQNLRVNLKKVDLQDVFGMIKKRKMSGQEAKNLAREGWN